VGRLFLVGFLAMAGQVVLLRELAAASFGVELVYLLGLGLWLAAGATGALAGGREAAPPFDRRLDRAFPLFALLLLAEILFLRGSRVLLGGVPGAYLPLGRQAVTVFLGIAPAGAFLGWCFVRAARQAAAGGTSLARAYGWESLGGVAGSVAATLTLLGPLSPIGPLDRLTLAWNHPALVAAADTPYGRAVVTRADGQTAAFLNDALIYESEGTEAEEFVSLSALQAKAGPAVLVLGGGAPGVVEELLRHRPARVDVVEGDYRLLRLLLPHLPPATREALTDDPRVRLLVDDPRRFLSTVGLYGGKYDLILVAAGEPSSGESNRFYTVQFFRLCASRLAPGGVLALRLPSAENLWTPALLARNAAVFSALRAALPEALLLPGATDILLGSRDMLVPDDRELARRMGERGVAGRVVTPQYLRYLLTNERMARASALLREADVPPNSDARPACYRLAALLWLERFFPGAGGGGAMEGGAGPRIGLLLPALAAALLALYCLCRRRFPRWRGPALAAAAGFAGMALEAVVLLRFQAETGSLYRDIGLLLTSFMAGLAAGALLYDRLAGPRPAPRQGWRIALPFILCGALSVLAGGVSLAAEGGGFLFRLAPAAALLFAGAALTGALFAHASRVGGEERPAPLYAADLAGGCLAALLAGLWLIPVLGVGATAAGVALLAVAAMAAV
jgi:spermidine synthase